ncbi:SMC family ATPase [Candidatus Woesearchaeota archaeon]|nr:SMC family ATPase [Candidatus Woesearchaeota archaeon]
MLLQQLRLQNIRSYIDGTISFPEGTTLLSGDIGSGKSTILLAIEFALFGSSRPELPAESLLRKGAAKGMVELAFSLNNQTVIVQRHLKKEKDAIKQMPGHIIYNNVKKELLPVELKAEILTILGYPEDLLSKNKNYIFRYTIYTPQEEMKLILQDSNETRLDVLRKIFNIDKYKIIRENLQIYLKKMRTDLAVLTTKIEPLSEYTQLALQQEEEKKKIDFSIQEITPLLQILQKKRQLQQEETEKSDQQQKEYLQLQQEINLAALLEKEISSNLEQLLQKKEHLVQKIEELSIPKELAANSEQLHAELRREEKKKDHLLKEKNELEGKIRNIQNIIVITKEEITRTAKETAIIPEAEKKKAELVENISLKKELLDKKGEIDLLLEKTSAVIVKNKTLLEQSAEIQETMQNLENCPTCLQEVSAEHKHAIIGQEQAKIIKAQALLSEMEKTKKEIISQKESLEKQILDLFSKENQLAKINAELQQLKKKEGWIREKTEQLRQLVQENNSLMLLLQNLSPAQKIEEITLSITEKQRLLQGLLHQELLHKNLQELLHQEQQYAVRKNQIQKKKEELLTFSREKKDLTAMINIQKKIASELIEQEKETAVKLAQFQTQLENVKRHYLEIQERVSLLQKEKERLGRTQELYCWLEEHLLPLTYTIEKQVMVSIHHHFDLLFQEWFSVLIEDVNISSRLDDSFAPVIMQNGYEIAFSDLSGGEKTSAALAYRLALNKVINTIINTINTKELLILDEPTDGFSIEQLDKVREVLEKLQSRQTIIVSHESKIESFVNNVIRIEKEGHISSVLT